MLGGLTKRGPGRPLDPERSRLIAEAAWKLLAKHGYDALSFDAIAREVGCNRATIYRRYSSKSELISSVLRETLLSLVPDIDGELSPREALAELVKIGAFYLSGERGSAMLNVVAVAYRHPEIAKVIDDHISAIQPFYLVHLKRINPLADPAKLKLAADILISGIVYHQTFRRSNFSDDQIDMLIDLVITMLERKSPAVDQ